VPAPVVHSKKPATCPLTPMLQTDRRARDKSDKPQCSRELML
jgi:hypothetical protein